MFQQMNQGRQDAISGLAVNAQQLGLLQHPPSDEPGTPPPAKRRKKGAANADEEVESGLALRLGRIGRLSERGNK